MLGWALGLEGSGKKKEEFGCWWKDAPGRTGVQRQELCLASAITRIPGQLISPRGWTHPHGQSRVSSSWQQGRRWLCLPRKRGQVLKKQTRLIKGKDQRQTERSTRKREAVDGPSPGQEWSVVEKKKRADWGSGGNWTRLRV